jgi:hypothetical protein
LTALTKPSITDIDRRGLGIADGGLQVRLMICRVPTDTATVIEKRTEQSVRFFADPIFNIKSLYPDTLILCLHPVWFAVLWTPSTGAYAIHP